MNEPLECVEFDAARSAEACGLRLRTVTHKLNEPTEFEGDIPRSVLVGSNFLTLVVPGDVFKFASHPDSYVIISHVQYTMDGTEWRGDLIPELNLTPSRSTVTDAITGLIHILEETS